MVTTIPDEGPGEEDRQREIEQDGHGRVPHPGGSWTLPDLAIAGEVGHAYGRTATRNICLPSRRCKSGSRRYSLTSTGQLGSALFVV